MGGGGRLLLIPSEADLLYRRNGSDFAGRKIAETPLSGHWASGF
jgi:hypothetical protein